VPAFGSENRATVRSSRHSSAIGRDSAMLPDFRRTTGQNFGDGADERSTSKNLDTTADITGNRTQDIPDTDVTETDMKQRMDESVDGIASAPVTVGSQPRKDEDFEESLSQFAEGNNTKAVLDKKRPV